jgi:hypothetical protein
MATRKERRGCIAVLDHRFLEDLFHLPDGVAVRAIYQDAALGAIYIHFEGDTLPSVKEGCYPKQAYLVAETKPALDGGNPWRRIALEFPKEANTRIDTLSLRWDRAFLSFPQS